jgi:hypothetical protein
MAFIPGSNLSVLTSLSISTFYRLRSEGVWDEGIHYSIVRKRVLYNFELIQDWISNQHQPQQHERAIQNYLASLPSSQLPNKKAVSRTAPKL